MWECPKCGEAVEDSFDKCWNCGTSTDGTADPNFSRVEDDPSIPDPGSEVGTTHLDDASRSGIAFSSLGDFALLIGQASALVGCGFSVYWGVLLIREGYHAGAILVAPIVFFVSLANWVVFTRVGRL